jgi:predicted ATPase
MLTKLTLEGFKSFRKLELELRPLNVLIGANGAGKSNFISFLKLLIAIENGHLRQTVGEAGGADIFLWYGKKKTNRIVIQIDFEGYTFSTVLTPDATDSLFQSSTFQGPPEAIVETQEAPNIDDPLRRTSQTMDRLKELLGGIRTHHMQDTSSAAAIRKTQDINDNLELRSDGGNLAAILYLIHTRYPKNYQMIRDVIRSAAPYFDDFLMLPDRFNEDKIRLEWREHNSDYLFQVRDLSDGTLRFMVLATLLLQPNPPAITVIDEPELGLHPFAIEKLAGLLQVASSRTQLIVATQSPQLISALEPEDVIVADREEGETVLRRLDAESLEGWLEEYTLGELWQKNILGGVVNPNGVRSRGNS